MRLRINRNSADWTVTARTSGNHHHAVISQQLPSFKGSCCVLDLIDGHTELNMIANIFRRWGTRSLNANGRCTDRINSDGQYDQLQRPNQNNSDYLESRHCILR